MRLFFVTSGWMVANTTHADLRSGGAGRTVCLMSAMHAFNNCTYKPDVRGVRETRTLLLLLWSGNLHNNLH